MKYHRNKLDRTKAENRPTFKKPSLRLPASTSSMVRLDSDKFLTELKKLFEKNESKGSVFVTMKRTNEKPRRTKKDYSNVEPKCLIRATDGKRKVSATLVGKDLARFKDSYDTILKAHMDALKKRERRQKKDTK